MRSSVPSIVVCLLVAACSAPNPLNGIGGVPPGAGQPSSSSSNGPGSGDDDGNGNGAAPIGGGSTPSPITPHGGGPEGDAGSGPIETSDAGGSASEDGGAPSEDGAPPAADGGVTGALLAHCVATLNAYRTQAAVTAALTESSALESYAALASASDSQSGQTHGYYSGNDGSGVSSAESELPGWPLSQYASLTDLVDQGIAAIYQQGPGAAPYDNLVNAMFTQAGCGFAQTADGTSEWVAIEYK